MYTKIKCSKGFTIVELIFVLVLLIILVAVTTPLMKTAINRIIAREAITTLRTILATERKYYSKYSTYTDDLTELGFLNSELDGAYFSESSYVDSVTGALNAEYSGTWGSTGIQIRCIPANSDSPKANVVNSWGDEEKYIGIDRNDIIYSNLEWLGYEEFE